MVPNEADRYIIVDYIAEGGMGAIFLGKKVGMEGFEKEVVLKQLLPEFTSQPEFIDLFLREAKLSATLDHANIVHTIDLVAAEKDYFIVMEYVRGGDLRNILRRIKQRGYSLHAGAALFIAREVLSALAYAHEKKSPEGKPLNLIHRDISPSNIMLSEAGEVKLTDFGIAKVSTHKSVFYRVKGKVGYMSPEQAFGDRPLDHRSDLYSLGVCLHEMLSGARLFVADLLSAPSQIYSQRIPALEGIRGIPRGIDTVLEKALAFEPENRFQTAHEFQDAIIGISYENNIFFTSPDLSQELRIVCGENPQDWNRSEDDVELRKEPTGTELLDGEYSDFSKVELTSIFSEMTQDLRKIAKEPSLPPPMESEDPFVISSESPFSDLDREPTRNVTKGREPTNTNYPPQLFPPEGEPGLWDGSTPLRSESFVQNPGGPDEYRTPSADQEFLIAMQQSGPSLAAINSSPIEIAPQKARSDLSDTSDFQNEATVDLRSQNKKVNFDIDDPLHPGKPEETSQSLVEKTPAPSYPIVLTSERARIFQTQRAKHSRQQILLMIIAGSLFLAGGAIVALIGLTGPDFDSPKGGEEEPSNEALKPLMPLHSIDASKQVSPKPHDAQSSQLNGMTASSEKRKNSHGANPGKKASSQRQHKFSKGGTIIVESAPHGAKVFLDSVLQCRTPCTVKDVNKGRIYLLSVRHKGYVSWSALVDMRVKKISHFKAMLVREPNPRKVGYLLIRSNPRAEVRVNNKEIGRVTSEGRIPFRPGQYEIRLVHPNRKKRPKFIVVIRPRKTVKLWKKF